MKSRLRRLFFVLVVSGTALLSLAGVATAAGNELVVALNVDPVTLNPVETTTAAYQCVYAQIIEQLVIFSDDGGQVLPWLATSWQWVDSMTLELKLREGVVFTNGEPADATAAAFSIQQFITSPRYVWLLPAGFEATMEVVDTYTLRVHMNQAYSPFLGFLARGGAVLPPQYYQQVGATEFGQHPIGTGPFVLDSRVKDSHIVLARNTSYWGGLHPVERIRYRIIPEEASRVAAFETGEVDIAVMIPASAVQRLSNLSDRQVVTSRGLRKAAIYFDTFRIEHPVAIENPQVRLACCLAVDLPTICSSLYNGMADPLEGQWMTRGALGFNDQISMYPYDPAEARRLLADAGYANGFELQLSYTVGRFALDKALGEAVSSYLEAIGISVIQRPMEYGPFNALDNAGEIGTHQKALLVPPDPHFAFSLFTSPSAYTFTKLGPRFDELVNLGYMATDLETRQLIYDEMAQIMYDVVPMIPLVVPRDIYGVSNRVEGFTPRVDQVLWFFGVSLK